MNLPFLFDEKRFSIPPNAPDFIPDTEAGKKRDVRSIWTFELKIEV